MDNPTLSFSRKELYDELWRQSAKKVAGKYGLKYSKLLQRCKEANIPTPPSGYWTKVDFGKPVTVIPLPESDIETVKIELNSTANPPSPKHNSKKSNNEPNHKQITLNTCQLSKIKLSRSNPVKTILIRKPQSLLKG